jgi:hypothetical protein
LGKFVGSEITLFVSRKDNKRNLRLSKEEKEVGVEAEE